jgi:hypothetical protein
MANIGENKGRRLRIALQRFSAMLIEEARDITGMSFPKLNAALAGKDGPSINSFRWSLYPLRRDSRAPQAASIQWLENSVAKLLKRPAHEVVIYNTALINSKDPYADLSIGKPAAGIDLRDVDEHDLHLGYADEWPTYRRLKYSRPRGGVHLISLYAWQYGILWDRGVLKEPWTREALGLPADIPVESFLPGLVEKAKQEHIACMKSIALSAGNLPE